MKIIESRIQYKKNQPN